MRRDSAGARNETARHEKGEWSVTSTRTLDVHSGTRGAAMAIAERHRAMRTMQRSGGLCSELNRNIMSRHGRNHSQTRRHPRASSAGSREVQHATISAHPTQHSSRDQWMIMGKVCGHRRGVEGGAEPKGSIRAEPERRQGAAAAEGSHTARPVQLSAPVPPARLAPVAERSHCS